jgi:3-mercaptopyruvate sulfurtransferase SseA
MDTIHLDDLRALLDADAPIRLVTATGRRRHDLAHIPGAESFDDVATALTMLDPGDDIVVYGTSEFCPSGRWAHRVLTGRGYRRVQVFRGGLDAWASAGLPLHGTFATDLAVTA